MYTFIYFTFFKLRQKLSSQNARVAPSLSVVIPGSAEKRKNSGKMVTMGSEDPFKKFSKGIVRQEESSGTHFDHGQIEIKKPSQSCKGLHRERCEVYPVEKHASFSS